MAFIVIEGDNGTGKDTLAQLMNKNNQYKILTYDSKIREIEKYAKDAFGEEKIKRFLEYGKASSDFALKQRGNIILVRYWISTLAAAYADGIYDYNKICEIMKNVCCDLCKPDIVFCLWCNFDSRINRIKERNSTDFDDTTIKRSLRYEWILKKLEKKSNLNWININTTGKSVNAVYHEACKYLENK